MQDQPVVVHALAAQLEYIQTPVGLVVTRLEIESGKATLIPKPFALKLEEPATWKAVVEEGAVQMLVEAKAPSQLKNVKVSLVPDVIQVRASVQILVDIPVEAVCRLAIREARQLWIELESVSLGGGPARNLVQQQLDKINPILDVADLPLDLRFERVAIEPGAIHVFGTLAPTEDA